MTEREQILKLLSRNIISVEEAIHCLDRLEGPIKTTESFNDKLETIINECKRNIPWDFDVLLRQLYWARGADIGFLTNESLENIFNRTIKSCLILAVKQKAAKNNEVNVYVRNYGFVACAKENKNNKNEIEIKCNFCPSDEYKTRIDISNLLKAKENTLQEVTSNDGMKWVDLGLPSGTLWAIHGEMCVDDIPSNPLCVEHVEALEKYGALVPTKEDWEELMENTNRVHTPNGLYFSGKNGASIFLHNTNNPSCDPSETKFCGNYWVNADTDLNTFCFDDCSGGYCQKDIFDKCGVILCKKK